MDFFRIFRRTRSLAIGERAQALQQANSPHWHTFSYVAELNRLWSSNPAQPRVHNNIESEETTEASGEANLGIKCRIETPPPNEWAIAFSPSFLKRIATIDRTLQGRILLALGDLTDDPLQARGDTVKPLTGDSKGLWRYRIGDFRMVHFASQSNRIIEIRAFEPRGNAYT